MTLETFNKLSLKEAQEELFKCCGSSAWVKKLSEKFPFSSTEELKNESDKIWFSLNEKDWKEAFSHHPKIGDIKSLEKKFASTKQWASAEQSGVNKATENVLQQLKEANDSYEKKIGYIFIICAAGKSAQEMLSILQQRLKNKPDDEIIIAMKEQNKITHLRIEKLFS